MLVVVLRDVCVGNILDLQLGLEVLLDQLCDHLLLHDPPDLGILVVGPPGRLGRDRLELHQLVDELALLCGIGVAGAHERRLFVDPRLHVADGDDRVVDPGDDRRRIDRAFFPVVLPPGRQAGAARGSSAGEGPCRTLERTHVAR
jgi:hypothetical protein